MRSFEGDQGGHDPPRIANVFQLLRSTIQPATRQLTPNEPLQQSFPVSALLRLQSPQNGEQAYDAKDVPAMTFRARNRTVAAIEILASANEGNRQVCLQRIQPSQQRQGSHCAVTKARIDFPEFVASKSATLQLSTQNV